jgi:hypothetical protein
LVGYIFCIIDYHICRDIFGRIDIMYYRLSYVFRGALPLKTPPPLYICTSIKQYNHLTFNGTPLSNLVVLCFVVRGCVRVLCAVVCVSVVVLLCSCVLGRASLRLGACCVCPAWLMVRSFIGCPLGFGSLPPSSVALLGLAPCL